jgi:hypothetical protein
MKKIISLLLSCSFLFFLSMGQNSIIDNAPFVDNKIHLINTIKQENSENPTATYMPLNDNNEADDPESLAYDILLYYGIEPGQVDIEDDGFFIGGTKMVSSDDILNIENGSNEKNTFLEVSLTYNTYEGCVVLTASNDEYNYEESIELYPEFSDYQFEGFFSVSNRDGEIEYLNIFEMEEVAEEELEPCFLGIAICGIALWKLIAATVVVTVAVTMVAYPEFYVSGIESLCDELGNVTSQIIGKIKHNFTKMVDAAVDRIEQIRQNNNKNIYYLAIPIVKNNENLYPDVERGDMLISAYPVTYSEAKKALRAGYSIYTFEENDAYRAVKFAWVGGIAIDEPCDDGFAIGFYSHYHAYYRSGNEFIKRYVWLDGAEVSIHGFYGYPW